MNKKQFIERMVEHTDSPKGEARKHLEAFTTSVSEALKAGEEVQLPGFGKFYVREPGSRAASALLLALIHPSECVEGEFSEVRQNRVLRSWGMRKDRGYKAPVLGRGTT